MDVRHNNNALKEFNDCIGGLLHLGLNVITSRTLLQLGQNVITFRTLLHLGQLLHLGLQQRQHFMVEMRMVTLCTSFHQLFSVNKMLLHL